MSDMTTPPPEDAEPTPAEIPRGRRGRHARPGAAAAVATGDDGAGGWGPPGKIRSWGVVAILTIITCGIYGLFWQYYVFEENKQHSGDGVGGVVGVILAIFIGIVNIFLLPAEVGNIYAKAGQEKPVRGVTGLLGPDPDRRLVHLALQGADRDQHAVGADGRRQGLTRSRRDR